MGRLDLYVGGYVCLWVRTAPPPIVTSLKCVRIVPPAFTKVLLTISLITTTATETFTDRNVGSGGSTSRKARISRWEPLTTGLTDGWPDLFVANDGLNAYLYHNEHNGTFNEIGLLSGIWRSLRRGSTMAAMCISLGDYDNDGWLDLYGPPIPGKRLTISGTTTERVALKKLAIRAGHHRSHKRCSQFRLEASSTTTTTVGLDLFIANGHVYPEGRAGFARYPLQANQLFIFTTKATVSLWKTTKVAGSGFEVPYVGRGVAFRRFSTMMVSWI